MRRRQGTTTRRALGRRYGCTSAARGARGGRQADRASNRDTRMLESPNVRMALASRAENVVLVRDVLAGLGDGLDLGGTVEDIKAAVSEAANNVVVHAYGGGE